MFLEVYPQVLGVSTFKVCRKCGEPKSSDEFSKDASRSDGLCVYCKVCIRNYQQANHERISTQDKTYRTKNAERIKARHRQYYADHHEAAIKYARGYKAQNRVRIRATEREQRRLNPEETRAKDRAWYAASPDRHRARQHNRRVRVLLAHGAFTPADIEAIRVAQGNRCYLCGKVLKKYHIDHFIPLALGGTNDPGNLRLACPKCNQSKGAKHPHDLGRLL